MDYITVVAPAANISATTTSASITIPNASDGNRPRYIRVAATGQAFVNMGIGAATATVAGGTLVQNADAVVMQVPSGVTHIAAITATGTATVNVAPLEQAR